jgi:23S rRNA U2552 (ribose-2'-O)-methylase RlmE/FtsJ
MDEKIYKINSDYYIKNIEIEIKIIPSINLDIFLPELGDQSRIIEVKDKIEKIDPVIWTKIRKYLNIYESPFRNLNYLKKPVSRAYYKLQEILIDFDINCYEDSFHIAESPGGFIQSIIEYRNKKKYDRDSKCFTVSLLDISNNDIPIYSQFIKNHKNVDIINTDRANWSGNITDINDVLDILKYIRFSKLMHNITLVTADGGINDKGVFNNKENAHINLFFCEITIALCTLNTRGTFILKIFDIYTTITRDLILLLTMLFEEVYITKPLTSRPTNSEKYIVCKYYKKKNFTVKMKNCFIKTIYSLKDDTIISRIFGDTADYTNINGQLKSINTIFCKNQAENIIKTLDFIKKNNFVNIHIDYSKNSNFNSKKDCLNSKWIEKYK